MSKSVNLKTKIQKQFDDYQANGRIPYPPIVTLIVDQYKSETGLKKGIRSLCKDEDEYDTIIAKLSILRNASYDTKAYNDIDAWRRRRKAFSLIDYETLGNLKHREAVLLKALYSAVEYPDFSLICNFLIHKEYFTNKAAILVSLRKLNVILDNEINTYEKNKLK